MNKYSFLLVLVLFGTAINITSTSLLRFPATGTAGQQRAYIELQGVHANDHANENVGAFINSGQALLLATGPRLGH